MRTFITLAVLLLTFDTIVTAQDKAPVPSPSDVAPPSDIVIPVSPEEIPPPSREPVRVEGDVGTNDGSRLKIGTIVSGDVPLYPKVRVENADEIHPRAVPVILAVMDPRDGPWHPHHKVKRLVRGQVPDFAATPIVFVKVFVAPAALRNLKIRREEIDIEFGDYEVNIDSEDGIVTVEYDD